MVRAVILIKSPLVLSAGEVRKVDGVKDAFDVTGRFDSVAYVDASDISALKKTVFKIQAVKGVRKTETMVEL